MTVSEYVMVGKIFDKEPVKIIGSLERTDWVYYWTGRTGVLQLCQTLEGKRVGVIPGTNPGIFLGRFLELHGMNPKDLTWDVCTFPAVCGTQLLAARSTPLSVYHPTIKWPKVRSLAITQ